MMSPSRKADGEEERNLTIIRLGCSLEIGVARMRDRSDLRNRRWYICNIN
jgi:hypothetical protein